MTQTSTTITVDSLPIANSIDPVQDRTLIYTASATDIQGISRNTYLGLSSQPVGISDSQTLTAKVLDNSNTITVKDTNLTIQDDGDATKQAKFQASGITTGTTRTYTLPDTSDTLTTNAATQTLTNKTLTSPVITGGSIDNTNITVDTISGHTTSNAGTIYGVAVSSGTISSTGLASNSVTGAKIASYSTNRSNNGSNVAETTAKMQTGWIGAAAGSTTNTVVLNVTFPVAFTGLPIVVATNGGDQTSGAIVYGNGGSIVQGQIFAKVTAITTTGCIIYCFSPTANWVAANVIYAQWIAIGA